MIPKKIMKAFEEYCEKNNITGKAKDEKLEMLKKLVLKYLYEPGEAIGIIAAQSISEPATQMSLDFNESIILKHKDAIKISTIGHFTDEMMNAFGYSDENEWHICDTSDMGIFVPSINQDEKIEWKRVLACSRHASPEKLLKIKTISGREIAATDSHSFVVRRHNKIMAISGKNLVKGERIPALKLLPEHCIDFIDLKTIVSKERESAKKKLPEKFELNNLTGWIFGAYLSEGNCVRNFVSISNTDADFLERTRQFADAYGLSYNEYDNFRGFAKGHDIHINSSLLSSLLAKTCGMGSRNKKIPDFAYSANEAFVSALLRAYFDGDGNVSTDRFVIRASSNSKELIDGIALMLARFRIFSYKGKTKNQYTISIPVRYAHIFREKIGFSTGKKAGMLERLCNSKMQKQDFVELVGGFDNLLLDLAKKLDYPSRYVNSFTKRQKIGKSALLKYIVLFSELAKKNGINIDNEIAVLKRMHASDVVWDEIAEIEEVLPSAKFVYDLTVEGTETFTTFDGIITHNTMRSYTMASQSDRLSKVTHGLPRLIEIFDARKTYEKNMIIFLKPEYNFREKAKYLANSIKDCKITDLLVSDSIDLVEMRIEMELEREGDKDKVKEVLDSYAKSSDISYKGKKIYVKPEKNDVKNLRKLKNKILRMHVDGVKGVENVIVIKEGDDWTIQTTGANLKKILALDWVDISKTTTNDVFQIYETLGIEAARNIIIQEAKKTLDEQGLDVDLRHIILLADMMTFDGTIKDIGRYGVSGKKASVLARANFEETKRHLVNAAFYGESDKLMGVIENVLIGQIAPIGTGMVTLAIDMEKMRKGTRKDK